MRIGIDARLWNETGVGRYIRNLVKYLQVLDKKNEYVLFVGDTFNKEGRWKMEDGKWKIVKVNIRWHSLEEQVKFPNILKKEKLDLVHFPYFSVPVFYNKPFVITIHDLILHSFSTGEASTLPLPLYKSKLLGYKFVISKAAKNARKIIVPTNAVKEEVIRKLKVPESKIVVTYEGIDDNLKSHAKADGPLAQKFNPPASGSNKYKISEKKFFLYVGNAYPHKNLKKLMEAFKKFKENESYKDIELLLVGRDDYFYKKIKEELLKENLNSVKIIHNADDNLLSYLYRNAIALIIPSLMEGFGLTALEAMSNNCLVLASNIAALKEICAKTAIYFDPKDVNDIKLKMELVLAGNFNDNAKFGFARSKEFSWEKMVRETINIYKSFDK